MLLRAAAMLVALSSFLLIPGIRAGAALPVKPNIVLILADDMRAIDVPLMPQVTALANHGVMFTNGFVSTSLCCPSRSGILTGQYSHNTKVYDNVAPTGGVTAFNDTSTVATWLKGAGYSTSLMGKYFNEYDTLPQSFVPPGWTDWHAIATGTKYPVYYDYTLNENGVLNHFGSSPSDYLTDVLASRAYDFVKGAPGPFFLSFNPFAPHYPSTPGPGDVVPTTPLPRPPSFNEADVSDKPWGTTVPQMTDAQITTMTTYYQNQLATLQSLDRAVGRIVQGLQERGVLENTVIVFTSDNGMMFGEHRIWNKIWPYDPSVRVPMVWRLPGDANAGKKVDSRFVMQVDLAYTFAQLAGVTPPIKQNGLSLVPLLNGQTPAWRTGVYSEFLGKKQNAAFPLRFSGFRTSQYKLIIYENGTREFYDLASDPQELKNVANDPAYDAAEASVETKLRQQQKA
ncbi:MAG: sulfatase [Actinomycetota bacterium]